jgi:hypothetical protein
MARPSTDPLSELIERIPEKELDQLITTMLDEDVPPIGLDGAERTRSTLLARKPVLDEVTELLKPLTESDRERIWTALGPGPSLLYKDRGGLARAIVVAACQPKFFSLPDSLMEQPKRASRPFDAHPELFERLDKKGLLRMDRSWKVDPQILFYESHALSYHQLLRRHFTSKMNDQLLGTLIQPWRANESNVLRVAIDERRMLPASKFRSWLELDHWYGPPLTHESLDDPNAVGVTRHILVPRESRTELFEYRQLLVRWTYDKTNNQKVCELEELVDVGSMPKWGSSFILLRYLHAIRDLNSRQFVHVDGAVRGYLPERYSIRYAEPSALGPQVGSDAYRKLWRIDGQLTTVDWSNMVARWFRHNELALEYLSRLAGAGAQEHAWAEVRSDRVHRGDEFRTETLASD